MVNVNGVKDRGNELTLLNCIIYREYMRHMAVPTHISSLITVHYKKQPDIYIVGIPLSIIFQNSILCCTLSNAFDISIMHVRTSEPFRRK